MEIYARYRDMMRGRIVNAIIERTAIKEMPIQMILMNFFFWRNIEV